MLIDPIKKADLKRKLEYFDVLRKGLSFDGRKSPISISNNEPDFELLAKLKKDAFGCDSYEKWESYLKSPEIESLSNQDFLYLMFSFGSPTFNSSLLTESIISGIASKKALPLVTLVVNKRGISSDGMLALMYFSNERCENKTVAHLTEDINHILEAAELFKFDKKDVLNLLLDDEIINRPIDKAKAKDYLRLFKYCEFSHKESIDFLTKKQNDESYNGQSWTLFAHRLAMNKDLRALINGFKEKMSAENVFQLLKAENKNTLSTCVILNIVDESKTFGELGMIIRENNLSDNHVFHLLFQPDSESKTLLYHAKMDSFYDFCVEARLKPEFILKIMSHLMSDPLPLVKVIDGNKIEQRLIIDCLSYLAHDLLHPEGKKSSIEKRLQEAQTLLDEKSEISRSWKGMIELMRHVHQKQGGSSVVSGRILSQSPQSHSSISRRLEKHAVIGGIL
jgi:hypothetical protein